MSQTAAAVRTEAFDYQGTVHELVRNSKRNVLVVAPMSAGKTRVGVDAFEHYQAGAMIATTRTACYQHFQTLRSEFGKKEVAIGTGDYALNRGMFEKSPFKVLTMFKLLRLALSVRDFVEYCPVLVLDEIDDLSPFYQLAVTIVRVLHPKVRIIAMTGTLHEDDLDAVANWLDAEVVRSDVRPMDLHFHLTRVRYEGEETVLMIDGKEQLRVPGKLHTPEEVSRALYSIIRRDEDTSPVLFFSSQRAAANAVCEQIADWTKSVGTSENADLVLEASESVDTNSNAGRVLSKALPYGVGLHHDGLLSPALRMVERVGQDSLSAICACLTLVRAVNFPFGHVVITNLWYRPPNAPAPKLISASMFQQVAARAGRVQFGKDGHVWIPVFSDTEEELVKRVLLTQKASKVRRDLGDGQRFATSVISLIHRGRNTKRKIVSFLQRTLWASVADRSTLESLVDTALEEILSAGHVAGEKRFVRLEGDRFVLTTDGHIAARLALHPIEYDLLDYFIADGMEFEELLPLLAEAMKTLDGVDIGESFRLVQTHGLGVYKASVPQPVKQFADYVQRMLMQAEGILRLSRWDKEEIEAWRLRIYRPFVCGQMPVANALFDVIGMKSLERLIRHSGKVMGRKLESLSESDLTIIARLLFGANVKSPSQEYLQSIAHALKVDELLWQTIISKVTAKEVA